MRKHNKKNKKKIKKNNWITWDSNRIPNNIKKVFEPTQ